MFQLFLLAINNSHNDESKTLEPNPHRVVVAGSTDEDLDDDDNDDDDL